jgi:sigma-B regulation protein RsbU (phosphoserine phosphatase)
MFMVRAISLARLLSREIAEPEVILARLNDELAADNPSGMFVTFICAVFESRSGRLALANAGHCRPLLLPRGDSPRWAVKNLGTALGFEPGIQFERTELTLHEGDSLVLYTDGVSEAFNPQEECYGNDRLLADATALREASANSITSTLLQNVRKFAGDAPQSDDIAILTLKVLGKPPAALMHCNHEPTAASGLPLPKGEGRGEGEGTVRQPSANEPAPRFHQPQIHTHAAEFGKVAPS